MEEEKPSQASKTQQIIFQSLWEAPKELQPPPPQMWSPIMPPVSLTVVPQ